MVKAWGPAFTPGGLTWKAEAEAGWHFSKGHTLFGTAYVKPGDAGAGVGYRFEF